MTASSETVVIIGGGVIGSFVAFFLRRQGFAGIIKVVERDSTYQFSSTALSAASIRTQFGCPFNIGMSLFSADLFRNIRQWFGEDADIGFEERGYLMLGSPRHADSQRDNALMQNGQGARVDILSPEQARQRYPWLNVEDIGIATYGAANEGWFDAWALLQLVRREARRLGVEYLEADVSGLDLQGERITGVRLAGGERLACDWCVNAAGAAGGKVAGFAGVALPVEPRKRTVFHIKAPLDGRDFPMLFDNSGAWIRPEGDGFIAGIAPEAQRDPHAAGDFEPDHYLLEETLWPLLAHRVPALEQLRLQRAWAGHYEMNLLDHNGVVGAHPQIGNFVFATGFSGHGVMHSPATGRAVAELIVHGGYRSLDLSPLGYERIAAKRPIVEAVVY
ncbi:NAD(P)/FAD-dependent oxidoreductase [Pseudomonas japonica]|uniref:Glycine/D-amino acid oxidase n=1 Tax=Pseudomonas japonica TaxID=256466 RepID=A0A239LCA5_9PSED|nr:FAD-binding oxidoreductase [Pseudomonas japonica]SNT27930.1 Glycine/D-amino acid oxidase [Pseudomonas japonica]